MKRSSGVPESLVAERVFHIVAADVWKRSTDPYLPVDFARDGFIHCSTKAQVPGVANALFSGRADLVLLVIDSGRVAAPIRYENLAGGAEEFPHLYGPLPRSAVVAAEPFRPGRLGVFDAACVERIVSKSVPPVRR